MKKVLSVVVVALGLLVCAGGAQAQAPFVSAGSFAVDQLSGQQRVAVERSTGRVFVADGGNDRIVVFAPTAAGGEYLTEFAGGEIDGPVGIAIDQSNGNVYVADSGNQRIARYVGDGAESPSYSLDGSYTSPTATDIGSFAAAIAIDPTTGDLLIADPAANEVKRFDQAGTLQDSFDGADTAAGAFTGLLDLAVDSTGDVVVVDSTGDIVAGGATSRVERFDSAGTSEGAIGSLDTPSTVAVIPGTDEVAVASNQSSYMTSSPLRVTVFDTAGTQVSETDLAPDTIYGRVTGLAAHDDQFNRLYIATDRDSSGFFGANAIQRLARDIRPTITPSPATDVTARAATVAATVDSNGATTTWQIEYRQAGTSEWLKSPATPQDIGAGTDPVTAHLTDLRPNTTHQWRIVARNDLFTNAVDGATFHTGHSAPRADTLPASDRSTTSVRLNGVVDPYGQPTTYYIEYGPTSAYGSSMPASRDGDAGAGSKPQRFSKIVSVGPGQALHYRIVAQNSTGMTTGEDRIARPAEGEVAYELVSTPNKNGGNVAPYETVQVAPSGHAAMYASTSAFGGAEGGTAYSTYVARRTADGWTTRPQTPPMTNRDDLFGKPVVAFSSDLTQAFSMSQRALAPGAIEGGGNLYLQDTSTGARRYVGGSADEQLIQSIGNASSSRTLYAGASADFRHVVFGTEYKLVPEAYGPDEVWQNRNVYEIADGAVRLASIRDDGSTAPHGVIAGRGRPGRSNAVSSDGRRIFFTAARPEDGSGTLYMREDGHSTVDIARSQRSGSTESAFRDWGGASADGSTVYFQAFGPLTDEAAPNPPDAPGPIRLYRWRDGELTEVVRGSVDSAAHMSVMAVSDDGKYVYFLTPGPLSSTSLTTPHLYVWDEEGGVRLIAALQDLRTPGAQWGGLPPGSPLETGPRDFSISPDGSKFAFHTYSGLVGNDTRNPGCTLYADAGGSGYCAASYTYDSVSNELTCVSCDPSGSKPTSHAVIVGVKFASVGASSQLTLFPSYSEYKPTAVFDDGTVYFDSSDRLVPEDTDGRRDGYRWRSGELTLLSPGTTADTVIADISADQRTVFLLTEDRLVGIDRDDSRDLYAVRAGGGFASQQLPSPNPPCVGDSCQGSPAASGEGSTVATDGVAAAGDRSLRDGFRVTALTKRQRTALASGGTVKVWVRVTGPTTLKARLTVRSRGRRLTVAAARTKAVRAGRVVIRLRLNALGRSALRRRGALAATLRIASADSSSNAALRVRLTSPPRRLELERPRRSSRSSITVR